jgi:hypothetical protein
MRRCSYGVNLVILQLIPNHFQNYAEFTEIWSQSSEFLKSLKPVPTRIVDLIDIFRELGLNDHALDVAPGPNSSMKVPDRLH